MILNLEQLAASESEAGIVLVLAGAGTGKTRTIVEKAGNILSSGAAAPEELLLLTFSRKGADELKRRIIEKTGSSSHRIRSATFHSCALSVIRGQRDAFLSFSGFSDFPSVLDNDESACILGEIIERNLSLFKGIPAPVIAGIISRLQSPCRKIAEKLEAAGLSECVSSVMEEYRRFKKKNLKIDYDDMISICCGLLSSDHELRLKVSSKNRYILVDEFQDTSAANLDFLRLVMPENNINLFAVGDDWQCIYEFRGASSEYIVNFKKIFPGASIFRLNTNYRSRKEIISVSSSFIKKNRRRSSKKLISSRGKGGRVKFISTDSFMDECEKIKKILSGIVKNDETVAVLARNNFQIEYIRNNIDQDFRSVQLMTMHSSKGLEFDFVIVAGISDRIIPDSLEMIEEERRLLYVALTRARESLFIMVHIAEDGIVPVFARELGYSG